MKLSILMMAYNQGKFIDEAISSVISQHLPFDWELLIGDDMSEDNTEELASAWVEKYPKNIIYHRNTENIGLHRNYEQLVRKAKGEYLALLEADDYWIDNMKSFHQVTFLDSNQDVAWCSTNGILVNEHGQEIKTVKRSLPEKFNVDFFIKHFYNPLNNSSVIRRSMEILPFPNYFFKVRQWDTVLYYLRSLQGNIGHLQINGLAWRRHEGATSFSQAFSGAGRYKDWITINEEMRKLFPKEMAITHFNNTCAYERLALTYWVEGQFTLFIRYTLLTILTTRNNFLKRFRDFFWSIRNPPS